MTDQHATPAAYGAAQESLRAQTRAVLKASGIRQVEACRQLGLSAKHMSQILTGKAPLTLGWAERIAGICGLRLIVTFADPELTEVLAASAYRAEQLESQLSDMKRHADAGWQDAARRERESDEWAQTCKRLLAHRDSMAAEVRQLRARRSGVPVSPEDDAWGSVWLHGKWSWLTKNMTTVQREYAADCVARWNARLAKIDGDEERGEPEGLRWWREAS